MTRIAAAKQLTASTKQAEVQSKAFTAEHKPSVPESYASARSPSTKPALDDSEITDLLKTLPGALESRMNNSGASDIVARATGIERIVLSMLGVDAPELQAVQKENLPFSGLSRHRYNLSTLANEIFGEASSLPTYSRPNISKSSHKTVSLHPSVALVDLPRAILPLVGVSTIPQSILGMTGSSGVPLALLQLKFGGGSDDQFSSEASASSSTSRLAALPESLPHLQLDQSDGSTLPRNPHHDYRIRHTASVHHRAKQIYAKGLSKDTSVDPWCARHRVQACGVCHAAEVEAKKSLRGRKSQDAPVVPGDGLAYFKDDILLQSGRRRPLASSLPDFLMVASDVFAVMSLGSEEVYERHVQAQDKIEFTPLSSFYDLVVDYITQAVLEGYTLHGWTGKEALEVLFSVGTGTWEERKWAEAPSSWTTPANSVPASCMPSRAGSPSLRPISRDDSIPVTFESTVSGSSTPESDDSQVSLDDDSEDEQDSRLHLIKSATNLFRTRTPAQADFEREMRDRLHEV